MCEITNPSSVLLSDRQENPPGTVVAASLEGTRPILIELQALTTLSVFGFPKITANGIDFNRLTLLIAVLENNYNEDGSIRVPKALQPYMGGKELLTPKK
mgnify:CR=1 FL=1